jgi:hypothetical protein
VLGVEVWAGKHPFCERSSFSRAVIDLSATYSFSFSTTCIFYTNSDPFSPSLSVSLCFHLDHEELQPPLIT